MNSLLKRSKNSLLAVKDYAVRRLLNTLIRLTKRLAPQGLRILLAVPIGAWIVVVAIYVLIICYAILMITVAMAGIYLYPLVPDDNGDMLINYICSGDGCARDGWLLFLLIHTSVLSIFTYTIIFFEEKDSLRSLTENPSKFIAESLEDRIYRENSHLLGNQRPADLTGINMLIQETVHSEFGSFETFRNFDFPTYLSSIKLLFKNISSEAAHRLRLRPLKAILILILIIYTLMVLGISIVLLISIATGASVLPKQAVAFAFDAVQRGALFDLYEAYDFKKMYDGPSNLYFRSADFFIRTCAAISLVAYMLTILRLKRIRAQNLKQFDFEQDGELASVSYILALQRYSDRMTKLRDRLEAYRDDGRDIILVPDRGQFDRAFADLSRLVERLSPRRLARFRWSPDHNS